MKKLKRHASLRKNNSHRINYSQAKHFSHSTKVSNPSSLRNLVLKKEFDKYVQDVDTDSSEKNKILKQIIDSIDAKKDMKEDLTKIGPAQEAIKKILNNETPLKQEFNAFSYLKDQYPDHFDEDSDSDSESNINNKKENLIKIIGYLGKYLKEEYRLYSKESRSLKKSLSKLPDDNLKRKIEDSSDLDPSKKSRQSVHDFVENLPTDHNPLDDIGLD